VTIDWRASAAFFGRVVTLGIRDVWRWIVRKVVAFGIALLLSFAVGLQSVPALAADERPVANDGTPTFQAFSKMSAETRSNLVEMRSEQLVSVEGEAGFCVVCVNAGRIGQTNASILTLGNTQTNLGLVLQSN
jgi:hypothetical protein